TRPETEFVATFVGKCNLVKGQWQNDSFVPDLDLKNVWPDLGVADSFKETGIYPVRPEQLQLSLAEAGGLQGIVSFVQYQGNEIHYTVEVGEETWTIHETVFASRFQTGDFVGIELKNTPIQQAS